MDQPFEAHYEGDTFIVPLFEETLVTRKRLVLRDEIRITKRQVERTVQESVRLRREEATVFREGSSRPDAPGQSSRPGDNSAEEL